MNRSIRPNRSPRRARPALMAKPELTITGSVSMNFLLRPVSRDAVDRNLPHTPRACMDGGTEHPDKRMTVIDALVELKPLGTSQGGLKLPTVAGCPLMKMTCVLSQVTLLEIKT